MTLNGRPCSVREPVNISELLRRTGFEPERVAVLLNGEIVPRDHFDHQEVGGQDALEVLSFVGGG